MLVGVPREIKPDEYRVGMVPGTVRDLVASGHRVLIEAGAGLGAGLTDEEYRSSGGEISPNAHDIYGRADLIVKVKEPLAAERRLLKRGQMIFTYLHLAPDPEQTRGAGSTSSRYVCDIASKYASISAFTKNPFSISGSFAKSRRLLHAADRPPLHRNCDG